MKTFKKMLTIVLCMALLISNSLSVPMTVSAEDASDMEVAMEENSTEENSTEENSTQEDSLLEEIKEESSETSIQESEPETSAEELSQEQPQESEEVSAEPQEEQRAVSYALSMQPAATIGDTPYPSLARAIAAASSGDTIVLQKDITESVSFTKTLTLTIDMNGKTWTGSGASMISRTRNKLNLTLQGGGILIAAEGYRVATLATGDVLTAQGVTFRGSGANPSQEVGGTSSKGGVIYANGAAVTLTDCYLENGNTTYNGGAVCCEYSASLTVQGGAFRNNHAGSSATGGGAIYISSSSLKIDGASFTGNTAGVLGGAIGVYSTNQDVEISNTVFENNEAKYGGALAFGGDMSYLSKAVHLTNITAAGNTASNSGGAIYAKAPTLTVSGSLTDNISGQDGGAIYSVYSNSSSQIGRVTLSAAIRNNTAARNGGGVYVQARYITFESGIVTANTATKGCGGGAYLCTAGTDKTLNGEYTLSETAHIYHNLTPGDLKKVGDMGASSEIYIRNASGTTSSAKQQPSTKLIGFTPAAFTDPESGVSYILSQYNGKYGATVPAKWAVSYYSEVPVEKTIYLDAQARHTAGENVWVTDTIQQAYEIAKKEEIHKIYVCSLQTVGAEEAAYLNDAAITWYRCKEHGSTHLFAIKGAVTLSALQVDGNNIESKQSLIEVGSGAHLTLTGSTLVCNGVSQYGGGISVNQGKLTMEGGTVINNRATKSGGGIYVQHGIVNLEGGTISYNTAGNIGGGVNARDYAVVNMGLNGGRVLIDHNTSYSEGGGISYERTASGEIYKATITNNQSTLYSQYVAGAGISVQVGASLKMKNVYVTDNLAKHYGEYGAVYTCPTGETAIFKVAGALITDNQREGSVYGPEAIDIYHYTSNRNNMVYVSEEALGGGDITFYKDVSKQHKAERSYYQYTTEGFAIVSGVSEEAKQWAKEKAEADGVVITGNSSNAPGSAIANNGHLTIGTEQMAMTVVKEWKNADGSTPVQHPDQVLVYLTRNGKVVDQATRKDASIVLSATNGWSYTWKNLDPDAEWSVVEASVPGFEASVSEMKKEEAPVWLATDEYYVRTLTNTKTDEPSADLTIGKTVYADDPSGSYAFTISLEAEGQYAYYTSSNPQLRPIYDNQQIRISLRNGETATIAGLPVGTPYTVKEEAPEGYLVYIDHQLSDTGEITGSAEQATAIQYTNIQATDIAVQKEWNDGEDQYGRRPDEISVHLLQNGQKHQTAQLNAAGSWQHRFTQLPKYDLDGVLYQYEVKEEPVQGYETEIAAAEDGSYVMTNTLLTDITVTKVWEDEDDLYGLRPQNIVIILQRSVAGEAEEEIQRLELSAEQADASGAWVFKASGLPVFNQEGQAYVYRITEAAEGLNPQYTILYDEPQTDAEGGIRLTVTNRLPMGEAQLIKTLNRYNATLGGATFVFDVKAELDGQLLYSNILTTDFAAPGQQYVSMGKFPVGTVITVEEVYSGSCYELVSGEALQTLIMEQDETTGEVPVQTAQYVNDYNEKLVSGAGIINAYTRGENEEGISIWNVTQHFSVNPLRMTEEGRQ